MNEGSILVPAATSAKSLTCVRSLGSRGIHTIVAAENRQVPASASRYCGETVVVPSPHDDLVAYKDALVSIAARPDVRTILPNREEDAYVLSKYYEEFAAVVTPVWPSFEALKTVHDGKRLAELAAEIGVPVPETTTFDEVTDWDRQLIVKTRYSILTADYVDFLADHECEGRLSPIRHRPGEPPDRSAVLEEMLGHVPIVQEFVPIETEYSFRALYDRGNPVATSLRRQDRGRTYAGGASVYRQLVENPTLEAYGRELLDALDWHGLATVQFIESASTGEYYLCEINPRIWTSIPCDVRAGADYPYFAWLLANGEVDRIDPAHDTGYATHLLFGELLYLYSVLTQEYPNVERPTLRAALRDVAVSLYRHPNFDYLRLDDPLPFVYGALNTVTGRR